MVPRAASQVAFHRRFMSAALRCQSQVAKLRWNEEIRADTVLVIGKTGEKLGVMSLEQALALAKSQELDLLEVSKDQNPPVCKLTKGASAAGASSAPSAPNLAGGSPGTHARDTREPKETKATKPPKEIKVGQGIESHDLQVKVNKIKEFLEKDLDVKITVLGKPRRVPNPKEQTNFFQTLLSKMEGLYTVTKQPKAEGRNLTAVLTKKK